MYCPTCGSKTQPEYQFCRSCGSNLWSDDPRAGVPSPIVGIMLTLFGIFLAILSNLIDHVGHVNILAYIGAFIAIIGVMSIAIIPVIAAKLARERSRRITARPEGQIAAGSTAKLPPVTARDEFFSVTDNTTELLRQPATDKTQR